MGSKTENGAINTISNLQLQIVLPKTDHQKEVFEHYSNGRDVFLHGTAGTGKTFISMYMGLKTVFNKKEPQTKIIVVRSAVPSRELGYLPGSIQDKTTIYELPYKAITNELFNNADAYEQLRNKYITFMTTSFVRGLTIDDAVVIIDEVQNMTDMEIHSVVSRIGNNVRLLICGDIAQKDLWKERTGIHRFIRIVECMDHFHFVEFGPHDICRSEFLKNYITAREYILEAEDRERERIAALDADKSNNNGNYSHNGSNGRLAFS